MPFDTNALAGNFLINSRTALSHLATGGANEKRSVSGDFQFLNALVSHLHLPEICTGFDDELLLKIGALAVKPQVYSLPHIAIHDL